MVSQKPPSICKMSSNGFKIVVVGSSGVGKTALVNQLVNKTFREDGQPTIGVEFKSYTIQADDESVKLQIWDTAGQERFRSVSKAYFRNAVGAILVFDLTSRQSFDELDTWINDLNALCTQNTYIILVGNKKDLEDRQIVETEGEEYAKRHNLIYLETSAKDGTNVEEAFARLGMGILRRVKEGTIQQRKESDLPAIDEAPQKKDSEPNCTC
ncbi:Ras family protein [Histomonas meleagridis]|uniref:Ras family protein n=1 Tax=Histomonas meleagridis TaxID=135588 RepID=UPI0035596D6E|nr:Ras family protein [Histomonas meleagridis]KAH0801198.1 Ras family protein [Histomonas meleagridis]